MKGINYDDWQAFLDERGTGPGWQWPLNLAVAMHLAVFGSAVMLQNMTGSSPGLKLDSPVIVNFISLSATGPLSEATEAAPVPAIPVPAAEAQPVVELTAGRQRKIPVRAAEPKAESKPLIKEAVPPPAVEKVKLEPKAVKKEAAAPVLVTPEPKVMEQVKPLEKTVELQPVEPVKKEVPPEPKIAERPAPKPDAAPAPVTQAKEAVSLNPVKPKEKDKAVAEKKAREQAEAAEIKRQAELAEAKKQEAVKAAKLEADKKAAAEAKRVAEVKAQKEKEAAKLAEVKKKELARIAEAAKTAKLEAEKKAAAAEARKRLAEQERQKALAEAQRVEHEAAAARQAAAAAREQLVRALRENMAVSTAAAASRGSGSLLGTDRGTGRISTGVNTAGLSNYARQLNEQISSRWKVPELAAGNRKLKTVVALTVNKNGTIEDLQIERQSGDPIFDQSVIKALRSAPLPKFSLIIPDKDRLEFALNFTPQGLTL